MNVSGIKACAVSCWRCTSEDSQNTIEMGIVYQIHMKRKIRRPTYVQLDSTQMITVLLECGIGLVENVLIHISI